LRSIATDLEFPQGLSDHSCPALGFVAAQASKAVFLFHFLTDALFYCILQHFV
jgi:hypothetical protein